MGAEIRDLSSIEIRNLMLDNLAYEEADIDSEGKTLVADSIRNTASLRAKCVSDYRTNEDEPERTSRKSALYF